jgi:hypothetical protein
MAITAAAIKTILDGLTYPENVHIYDYVQPPLRRKYPSIEVDNEGAELRRQFPHIQENSQRFLIHLYYRARADASNDVAAEKLIEDVIMAGLEAATLGSSKIFIENKDWNRSYISEPIHYIHSTLTVFVTDIAGEDSKVFDGINGTLTFDVSASNNMDSAPGGDRVYTAARSVRISEGFSVIEHMHKDTQNGRLVPHLMSGRFRGTFSGQIYADADDIGSTAEKLNQIYTLQSNGEHIEATFLHAVTNNSSQTLTKTSFVKVTSMEEVSNDRELVVFNVTGSLIKPSTSAVA